MKIVPIVLGDLVEDIITGFTGIAYNKTEWLNGCVRWGVQPRELQAGKPIEPQFFDEAQVKYVGPGVNVAPKETGGDRVNPARAADPR